MSPSPLWPAALPALDLWASRLLAAQGGSPKALQRLFEDVRPWWLYLARRWLGDPEEAQDAVQEASLRLLRCLGRFDPARCRQAKNWLRRLLRNCAIDRVRRRRPALPLDLDPLARADEAPDALAERRERAGRLAGLLGGLDPLEREALRLRFEEGLTYEQTAARLGVSLSAAYRTVNKALRRLARQGSPACPQHVV